MKIEATVGERTETGITALAQNSDPFTYFAKQPIHVCEDIAIDDGHLAMILLQRANQLDMLNVVPRLLTKKLSAYKHGQVIHFDEMLEADLKSVSTDESGEVRPFPVQVDGDYIGEFEQVRLKAAPGALTIIA